MNTFASIADRLYRMPEIIRTLLKAHSLHIGEYKWSCKNEDFNGWLLCDGRSLPRETYQDLFNLIGTSFGSIDADSFNLPDYRGRTLMYRLNGSVSI